MAINPLFPRASAALKRAALAEFRSTALGQTVGAMRRAARRGDRGEIARLQRQLKGMARDASLFRQLESTPTMQAFREVEKYGKVTSTVMDAVFRTLGPVGDLLKSLLRPRGRQIAKLQEELDTAANLLEMFGYGVTRPGQSSGGSSSGGSGGTATLPSGVNVDQARRELEALGFTVTPPPQDRTQPPIILPGPSTDPGSRLPDVPGAGSGDPTVSRDRTQPGMVEVRIDGQRHRIREKDPLLTGEMIRVQSSNVHSIGYGWNGANPKAGTLKVRYLAKQRGAPASGRGALYFYYDVPPQMFIAFQKAQSKGRWVWDHLRIRGTVSGHQKRYQLASIDSTGYVPRKAVRIGNEEWYLRRTVTGKDGTVYKSRLNDEMVRRLNRGKPRGPGNGRPPSGRIR